MAGAELTLTLEGMEAFQKKLGQLTHRLAQPRVAMAEVAGYLEEITRENFNQQRSPDGHAWAPLSPRYAKRKKALGVPIQKILHGETLNLRDHMHTAFSDTEASISTAGETKKYAATHQFGDSRRQIAARPFLGLSNADKDEILEIISQYLR